MEKVKIFNAFLGVFGEDAAKTRADAEAFGAFAVLVGGVDGLSVNLIFVMMVVKSVENKFMYIKYIVIGIFRMLEFVKATDSKAFEAFA